MSLLFYRRPDYLSRSHIKPELDESQCASYLETAEASRAKIPARLSFEEIIKNNTLPPCSLNDFMDYLTYIEYNAECLQFFLWYCGYVERWSKLSQQERDLSRVWYDGKSDSTKLKHSRNNSLAEKTERFNRILTLLEKNPKHNSTEAKPAGRRSQKNEAESTNFSRPRGWSAEINQWGTDAEENPSSTQPQAQPLRDEVFRVVRHYIATGGPRQLNLTHKDRTTCIQAVEQTTHPSALLPAFIAAEAMLRGQCHPNFIRWSVSNSNRSRVVFVRGLGVIVVLLGFIIDAVLILSSVSQWIRMLVTPLWIIGFAFLIASRQGICIILHWNYKRNLRPWEQFADDALKDDKNQEVDIDKSELKRMDTGSSTASSSSAAELPRKQELHSGDASNAFDAEPWVDMYHEKSVVKRVFDISVTTQNRHVRAMQDRVVFKAVVWGSLVALVLAICSVFVPSPALF